MKRNHFVNLLVLLVFFLSLLTFTGKAIGVEQKSPLSTPRMGAASATIDGEIYVIGGMTKQGRFSSLVEKYNPSTDKWSKEAPMPTPKAMAVAVALGKKIYVLGGRTSSGIINKVEIYDTESKSWKKGESMPISRWYHMATAVEGKIYAIGGRTGAGSSGYAIKSVDIYDPLKNSWSLGKAMPQARTGVQSAVIGNKIYVVGGAMGGNATKSIDVYDLSTETWSRMTPMKYARTGHCVCSIGNKIFIIGGASRMSLSGIIGAVEAFTIEK